jgi:hypothetical protein
MGKKEKEKKETKNMNIICYVHCYKSLISEKRKKERMLQAVRKEKET